jgi:ubiquitin carboxyl-terminal hydrolase 31
VPIYRDADSSLSRSGGGLLGSLRQVAQLNHPDSQSTGSKGSSSLEKCLAKFTAPEVLDGDNLYHCEHCKKKRKSVKQLMIYRYPKVLVIHIKRFRFNSHSREKLSTDVHFPLAGLDLTPFVRKIRGVAGEDVAVEAVGGTVSSSGAVGKGERQELWKACHHMRTLPPVYDLVGVSNHHGSLNGGHYIAHVDTNNGSNRQQPRWMCFNDARVSNAQATSIAGPTAYVLFYRLREHGRDWESLQHSPGLGAAAV